MVTNVKKLAADLFFIFIGCMIMALSLNIFMAPNNIISGGVVGISQVIEHLFGVPVGIVSFVLNTPLFVLGFMWLNRNSLAMTVVTTTILSVCIDITADIVPTFTGDLLFAAVLGGVVGGIGGGIIFMRGTTSGGTDLMSQLIRHKKPSASMGSLYLALNGLTVALAAIVYNDINNAFYAIASLYAGSVMIDKILSGLDEAKLAFIITSKGDEIATAVMENVVRGITILDGTGAYSKEHRKVLLCAVRRSEMHRLREFVRSVDPDSFLVFTNASEVWGAGFKLKEVI